jgi:hypothetical protein
VNSILSAAEILIAGAHGGSILDRGGKPYKPSTARGYEQLLRAYVLPSLGSWKLTQIQRRDVQDFADDLHKQGLSPSTIANILDPLRVIFRRAIRRDEVSIDPTDNPRPPGDPRPPRPDRAARASARVPLCAPGLREGLLGRRAVLRAQTRRAPRPPMDQRRLRRRRDPG